MAEQHSHQIHVPKGALIAAGVLILLTITAVAAFRIAGLDPTARIPASDRPLEVRELRFEDSPNGQVLVYDLTDDAADRVVHVVQPGEGGFIRGVLRSMARSRRASGIGREHPFLLITEPNGTLVLEDPQTGERIYLPAFGPTNIESFRSMLASDEKPQ
ncbi:MAG: photosynthetic complex assembly protein PuhC [Gammaproteobacteria bacterium]|jgi:putative photosynthetic complex assembly protein|nr:photosynthetic complex assembly protein PuhC [Gammaproteobacteria bacterium]